MSTDICKCSSTPCLSKVGNHSSIKIFQENVCIGCTKDSSQMRLSLNGMLHTFKQDSETTNTQNHLCHFHHRSLACLTLDSSRIDCSVHYNDGNVSPITNIASATAKQLFTSARSTVVHRVCGASSRNISFPGKNHPSQSYRSITHRHLKSNFRRLSLFKSDPCLHTTILFSKPVAKYQSENNLVDILNYKELGTYLEKGNCRVGFQGGNSCSFPSEDDDNAEHKRLFKYSVLSLWKQWKLGKDPHASNYNECIETYPGICHDLTRHKSLNCSQSAMNRSHSPSPYTALNEANHRQILGRQYSSPQPMKDRPFHRLPDYSINDLEHNTKFTHTKTSMNLRRSVSQPLDLDKSFQAQVSFLKIRLPDESSVQKNHRRPSVGNLLSNDNTSEEEDAPSDWEDLRQGIKQSHEEELIVFAEALWDHVSLDADELVFKAGDLITVVDSSDKEWWWGRIGQRSGWFPASFVRLLVNQSDHEGKESSDCLAIGDDSRKLSLFSISQDQVRANVVNEIISTERDYSKHLRDVVEGYLKQVRKRPDMFSEETISTIFGNMESLFNFHTRFLKELEQCIDYESPHRSCIGECFIRNRCKFEIYSEYCNNHPSAVSELQELYQDQRYIHFFEACRLLQQMIDISLDGFLLTPVQKICKYPLQLQELLKYTRANHIDYSKVHGAMRAMREVALLVNERRRRMECLEKIASWQRTVEGWEGPELLEDSSQLIHQGEVIKGIGGAWPKEVNLFLFDHQMVYCKRDLLKRNTFVYRGRINTDLCEVIDIPDDPLRSVAFHHSWKIHCLDKGKTYVFTCKTGNEKSKWIQAFRRERALVAMDEASGFVVSEKQKHVAKMAARTQKARPKKPRIKNDARKQIMTFAQAQLLIGRDRREDTRSNSLPSRSQHHSQVQKKKGHWFSFGGQKKNRDGARTQKQNSFHVS